MNLFEYLNKLETFGIKLGLSNTKKLWEISGYLGKNLKFIHIAGTNGKGSTGAMLQKTLQEVGYSVGFYTSPHLKEFNERIRVNGLAISNEDLDFEFQYLKPFAENMRSNGDMVTYFEFTTILAINYFARKNVDFVILETGMGGRYDSTNVVDSLISVITNISLDHQQYLGNTIELIAGEKAGIIKPNTKVFTGLMDCKALNVIEEKAKSLNSEVVKIITNLNTLEYAYKNNLQEFSIENYDIKLNLLGKMQRENTLLVFNVLKFLSEQFKFDLKLALKGLERVTWAGRCQKINNNLIVDGGHNTAGINALKETLLEAYPDYKFNFVFGSFKDKDSFDILKSLSEIANKFYFKKLAYDFRDSYNDVELGDMLKSFSKLDCKGLENWDIILDDINRASKEKEIYIICGSLYLVGEFLEYINFDLSKI